MPKKYHIHTKETAPRYHPVGKYATVEFRENCAGSCRQCVKKKCVYNIFSENVLHMSAMQEPEYLYTCMSCFRCIQECTKGIFSRTINPEYRSLGDDYWRADILHRLWYQAHMGKIPVSGAGYRGPFVAAGFDSMWTDMSEIVRPTRDGIHGREYINTCFELSRRITPLKFNDDMSLASRVPEILEVPMPLLFQLPTNLIVNDDVLLSAAKAARMLSTLLFIRPEQYTDALAPYVDLLIPCLTVDNYQDHRSLLRQAQAVELADSPGVENVLAELRELQPDVSLLVGLPADGRAADRAVELVQADVDSVHITADHHGREVSGDNPRFLKEVIREVHLKLVERSLRQRINLVFAGGIAMAEHMAKAVICGADGVAIDTILLVALECRLCYRCTKGLSCPVALDKPFDTDWAAQRIVNLVGAWHSQLIEVMGAMGIREVRRLRGEVGRSMWFEDLEREHFGPIFGERKVAGLGV
jgi:ferredoxin